MLSLVARASILFTLLTTLSVGCSGYSLVRYPAADGQAIGLSLGTLTNDSAEPGLELLVSDALRREVLLRGGLRLAPNPSKADLVLRGRVLPLKTLSRVRSSVGLGLETEVTLELAIEVERSDGSVLRVPAATLSESELYLASADLEAMRKNRLEALRRASALLAVRLHDVLDKEIGR